jgi:hypothetical protein
LRKITPFLGNTKSQKSNLAEQTIDLEQNFSKQVISYYDAIPLGLAMWKDL